MRGRANERNEPRLTILCGPYGTGKSECSVALALRLVAGPLPVTLIDLDVVNPYFRSREARTLLEGAGVTVIGNSLGIDTGVDVPAIPGTVSPALRDASRRVVVDLGGDPVGARAIRQFRPQIPTEDTDLLYVVNANRPDNRSVADAIASIHAIEGSVGLRCTGLVNNTHLLSETECVHIWRGEALCREITEQTGLPVVYTAGRAEVLAECTEENGELLGPALPLSGALRESWMDTRRD